MGRRLREVLLWGGAALGLLAVTAGLAVAFFGFSFLVFRSGSMEPEISTGGLALSRTVAADDIRTGDVVSVVASTGERITHRVVSTTVRDGRASLVLKGDANATPDSEVYVVASAERVVLDVPFAGYAAAHVLTPPGLLAVACLGLMLVVVGFARDGDDDAAAPSGKSRRVRLVVRRRAHAVTVLAVSVCLAGAALGSGEVSTTLARFTDPATAASGTFASARFFSCDAAVDGVSNPYLYWKLDETTGSTAGDSSGNNRPGLLGGSFTSTAAKACASDTGRAMTFNGSSSYIGQPTNRAAIAGPNTFTLSIWFRTTTSTGGKLLGFGNARTGQSTQYDRHLFMTNSGKIVFGVYPNTVEIVTSPQSYNDNTWHQAVASLSGAGMRLYVDGGLVASDPSVTTAENYSGYWRVGYDNVNSWTTQPSSFFFAGTLDEVAVYTTALTAVDVSAMYLARR